MRYKIKILLILFLVFFRYILRGAAVRKQPSIKKVLIFQGGKFGDIICTTPMFRAVKEAYPQAQVVVMGNALNKIVLEGNPDVDAYIIFDGEDLLETIRRVKRESADFACITAPSPIGLALLYLAGVPHIATPIIKDAWSPLETRVYRIMRRIAIRVPYYKGRYMPGQWLKLLEPIGIVASNTKKYVYWSKEAEAKVDAYVTELKRTPALWVGIMPGAGNKIKQWPAERFAEVANYLIERHRAAIFIIGSASNRTEIDTMLQRVEKKECVVDMSFLLPDELKYFMSLLDLTVSVDTGPVFIAEAHGIPTIDIGGVIHPHDQAPNDGDRHVLITAPGEPLIWSMNARNVDYEKAREGVESITVSTVIEKIDELLARTRST